MQKLQLQNEFKILEQENDLIQNEIAEIKKIFKDKTIKMNDQELVKINERYQNLEYRQKEFQKQIEIFIKKVNL